jgi:hypothetical protein
VVISSPEEFAAAVDSYRFAEIELDTASIREPGLLFVGEWHGMRENPDVLYALAVELGTLAVAFEWSHEEMQPPLDAFLATGSFDFDALWSLPPSAEFFCGDGRITTGHFALLDRLRRENRLEQVIASDRLDPVPVPQDWQVRDREMAERLLAVWNQRLPLLVLVGGNHARLDAADGVTMAMVVARDYRDVQSVMLEYPDGASRRADVPGPRRQRPWMTRAPRPRVK